MLTCLSISPMGCAAIQQQVARRSEKCGSLCEQAREAREQGWSDQAELLLNEAIRHRPKDVETRRQLAETMWDAGRHDEALAELLPLNAQNWITCGNALRLDWLSICPPTGSNVKMAADDLFHTPLDQAQIDFENEGGETYICGNPPYLGNKLQTAGHKSDLEAIFPLTSAPRPPADSIPARVASASLREDR